MRNGADDIQDVWDCFIWNGNYVLLVFEKKQNVTQYTKSADTLRWWAYASIFDAYFYCLVNVDEMEK